MFGCRSTFNAHLLPLNSSFPWRGGIPLLLWRVKKGRERNGTDCIVYFLSSPLPKPGSWVLRPSSVVDWGRLWLPPDTAA